MYDEGERECKGRGWYEVGGDRLAVVRGLWGWVVGGWRAVCVLRTAHLRRARIMRCFAHIISWHLSEYHVVWCLVCARLGVGGAASLRAAVLRAERAAAVARFACGVRLTSSRGTCPRSACRSPPWAWARRAAPAGAGLCERRGRTARSAGTAWVPRQLCGSICAKGWASGACACECPCAH
eukprot:1506953-Prymnesium_polylepis.2